MPFADELIGTQTVRALTSSLETVRPDLGLTAVRATEQALAPLSLRERSDLLRDALLADLPGDYPALAATVRAARDRAESFTGWLIWPVTSAVVAKAIEDGSEDAFDDALALIAELTPRLTAEFAIRGLLNHDLDRALAIIQGWVASEDEHVRRLATEGTRPFLPWSVRVPGILVEPRSTLPILHALYRDESEYVRRSVANHLNDLSRREPDLAVETATAWLDAPGDTDVTKENTRRLVRHGLRTLVKQGHPGALGLLGFTPAAVDVTGPVLATDVVAVGEVLAFTASVRNTGTEAAQLAVDYVIHHRKANGSQTDKTFKLTTRRLAPGEAVDLGKQHSFRVITTRRYYPGEHALELQVNGVRYGRVSFTLTTPPGQVAAEG
ncbi:3-methyladenine DNA glycosylase AlkC [Georgenia satyanarayanai]|uniref:3-methyladenine DNA glycosylase AlkC n=1 Tax=Georgenia satyanarayanai TaxID=860221 RepID=A0A2Y9C2U4_9MICO|nr:DNA alkylation repair protein [Georgenia satyanarayanai]PYG01890.1 3-methyladenine DNA glycosylase AlkC [Georgenia satyanarayanai]SSA36693.1 3-methyladenine DNA glycosylase AlkC [Georgenia satyanarayanai]